jgi:putative SOS response-associated peptidase YedK
MAPTDFFRYDPKAPERSLDLLRWGLVPYWASPSRSRRRDDVLASQATGRQR